MIESFVLLFHGTHKDNIQSFKRDGLRSNSSRLDSGRGTVFLSPRPDVAFAYAVMEGGETNYMYSKKRLRDVPDSHRALIVFKIPTTWYKSHLVREQFSNAAPEVSFNTSIPPKFIFDVIVGDRKKVYEYLT